MTNVYQRGQLIELNDGRQASVKFVGQTSFAPGDWIGVVLDEPNGKNDGSVQGQRYFQCDPLYGMFVRPSGISRILEDPTPKATKPKAPANGKAKGPSAATTAKGRPSSVMGNGLKRPLTGDPTSVKRQSLNAASPTPNPRALNGFKSPTKLGQPASSSVSSAASSRGATPASSNRRSTLQPPPKTNAPRSSLAGGSARPAATTSASASTSRPPRPSIAAAASAREPGTAHGRSTSTASPVSQPGRSTRPSVVPGGPAVNASLGGRAEVSKQPASARDGQRNARSEQTRDDTDSKQTAMKIHQQEQYVDDTESLAEDADDDEAAEVACDARDTTKGGRTKASTEHGEDDTPALNGNFAPAAPKAAAHAAPPDEKPPPQAPQLSAATTRQLQDLHTKVTVMEKQRDADREALKVMERLRSEKDRFEAIIQKLQAKLQPQQQELSELKRSLNDAQSKLADVENNEAEHETSLESAFLDREMAEETAEALKAELEAAQTKLEELELEVEVLREENGELSTEMSPEQRSSQGWLQQERRIERLTEALLQLRDVREAEKDDAEARVAELETDLKELSDIPRQYDEALEKLRNSEAAVESLKEQLDDALGAEQTIEELALDNDSLKEQIEDLRVSVRQLEDLREVNEELEANHVEVEREMQDELDLRNSSLMDQQRLANEREAEIELKDETISKFREVVNNLQNDIESLAASHQLTEAAKEDLNARSRAMTDLNMKLQSSAAKTQMNTIDLELRRLEAQEAIEHLDIVQMFLPETYDSERDSVLAYLRFIRVAEKARLLHSTLKSKVGNEKSISSSDDVFTICDVLDKLVLIAAMCDRFASTIRGCSLEAFARYTGALYEMDPVERGLNSHIDAIKKGDLRERDVAEGLQGSVALMTHLAEVHIKDDDVVDYAESILMRTTLLQSYLENTATALSLTNTMISLDGAQDVEEDDAQVHYVSDVNSLIAQSRSARMVAGKTIHTLNELKIGCATIDKDTGELVQRCLDDARNLATLTRTLGDHIRNTITEAPNLDSDADGKTVIPRFLSSLASFTSPLLSASDSTTSPISAIRSSLSNTVNHLQTLHTTITTNPTTISLPKPRESPWSQRASLLSNQKAQSHQTSLELTNLRAQLNTTVSNLAARDVTLSEAQVKIELLESRTRDAHTKAARITELSNALDAGRLRERELADEIDKHTSAVADLRSERDRYRKVADERAANAAGPAREAAEAEDVIVESKASTRTLALLNGELEGLRKAVRHLRADNARARLPGPDAAHLGWLHEPLLRHRRGGHVAGASGTVAGANITANSVSQATSDQSQADGKATLRQRQRADLSQEARLSFTRLRSMITSAQLVDLSHLAASNSTSNSASTNEPTISPKPNLPVSPPTTPTKANSIAEPQQTINNKSTSTSTSTSTTNRQHWLPLSLKPSYIHARQSEAWAAWHADAASFIERADELLGGDSAVSTLGLRRRRGRRWISRKVGLGNVGEEEEEMEEMRQREKQTARAAREAADVAAGRGGGDGVDMVVDTTGSVD